MPTVNPPPRAADDDLRLEYDARARRLTVTPADGGGATVYGRVPRAVYEAFERATSKGRFLATHIRPRYPVA